MLNRFIDCIVTLICWSWFIFGFIFFFSWAYAAAVLFSKNTERSFQRLNSLFFQIFFRIVRLTSPSHSIEIDEDVAAIGSAVIVSNHLSYLDPLLLIALFPRHRTIVKTRFFTSFVFGWIIRKSGYLPASSEGRFSSLMIKQMDSMESYLKEGGNLFVFPEGTRSRDGKIGSLNKGALKIARLSKAPIYALQIDNTDTLFTPGKFFFNTRIKNQITVKLIDSLHPEYDHNPPSTSQLEDWVHMAFAKSLK